MDSKYRVVLLDRDGYEIGERSAESLKEASSEMAYLLSDLYARAGETTHETMGTYKAEVRNSSGECVADQLFEDRKPATSPQRIK
jgi:hypothetical protein